MSTDEVLSVSMSLSPWPGVTSVPVSTPSVAILTPSSVSPRCRIPGSKSSWVEVPSRPKLSSSELSMVSLGRPTRKDHIGDGLPVEQAKKDKM